ncbi:hypothetical protein LTR17_019485 [Elasticomyces elasticus]|nr:hypothetical protein LTR17_019485 [Elasticomyces elasticus]
MGIAVGAVWAMVTEYVPGMRDVCQRLHTQYLEPFMECHGCPKKPPFMERTDEGEGLASFEEKVLLLDEKNGMEQPKSNPADGAVLGRERGLQTCTGELSVSPE